MKLLLIAALLLSLADEVLDTVNKHFFKPEVKVSKPAAPLPQSWAARSSYLNKMLFQLHSSHTAYWS